MNSSLREIFLYCTHNNLQKLKYKDNSSLSKLHSYFKKSLYLETDLIPNNLPSSRLKLEANSKSGKRESYVFSPRT